MADNGIWQAPICVLHSGGIDSTAVIIWYLSQKIHVVPLYIDYGNRTAKTEWKICKQIARYLHTGSPSFIKAPINHISSHNSIVSGKLEKRGGAFEKQLFNEFFPNRNLYLATLASMFCYQNGISTVAMGIIDGGNFGYTDTDSIFLRKANALFNHTLSISIKAPLVNWTKEQVIHFLQKKNFDISRTYSCNIQTNIPCGKCASCQERNLALKI